MNFKKIVSVLAWITVPLLVIIILRWDTRCDVDDVLYDICIPFEMFFLPIGLIIMSVNSFIKRDFHSFVLFILTLIALLAITFITLYPPEFLIL